MKTPITVSASTFRNNFFDLYYSHLALDARHKREVRVVNAKTKEEMLSIQPRRKKKLSNKKKKKYLEWLESDDSRFENYDDSFYNKTKLDDAKRVKELSQRNIKTYV